jgi:hypothetical protein
MGKFSEKILPLLKVGIFIVFIVFFIGPWAMGWTKTPAEVSQGKAIDLCKTLRSASSQDAGRFCGLLPAIADLHPNPPYPNSYRTLVRGDFRAIFKRQLVCGNSQELHIFAIVRGYIDTLPPVTTNLEEFFYLIQTAAGATDAVVTNNNGNIIGGMKAGKTFAGYGLNEADVEELFRLAFNCAQSLPNPPRLNQGPKDIKEMYGKR